jgi:hypothetical protein
VATGDIAGTAARWHFSRGFLVPALKLTVENFVKRDHAALWPCPLWTAVLHGSTESIEALAACPHLRRLSSLRLQGTLPRRTPQQGARHAKVKVIRHRASARLGPAVVHHLARSPHLFNLRSLSLSRARLGDEGLTALARAPLLRQLTSLELYFTDAGDNGVRALAALSLTAKLEYLSLCCNDRITDAGFAALASSWHVGRLKRLDVSTHRLSARAIAMLRQRFGDALDLTSQR